MVEKEFEVGRRKHDVVRGKADADARRKDMVGDGGGDEVGRRCKK